MSKKTTGKRTAWGWGLATVHEDGATLDTYYPQPGLGRPGAGDLEPPTTLTEFASTDATRRVARIVV